MKCESCGSDNDDWVSECWMCGDKLTPTGKKPKEKPKEVEEEVESAPPEKKIEFFCESCNAEVEYGVGKCPECGHTMKWDLDIIKKGGQEPANKTKKISQAEEDRTNARISTIFAALSMIFVILNFIIAIIFGLVALGYSSMVKGADKEAKKTAQNTKTIAVICIFISVVLIIAFANLVRLF